MAEQKLIQDVSTRWNSIDLMLERLLEERWLVTAVSSDHSATLLSDRDLDLTTGERRQWRTAEDIVSVLKPVITPTELFLAGCECISACRAAQANK